MDYLLLVLTLQAICCWRTLIAACSTFIACIRVDILEIADWADIYTNIVEHIRTVEADAVSCRWRKFVRRSEASNAVCVCSTSLASEFAIFAFFRHSITIESKRTKRHTSRVLIFIGACSTFAFKWYKAVLVASGAYHTSISICTGAATCWTWVAYFCCSIQVESRSTHRSAASVSHKEVRLGITRVRADRVCHTRPVIK